MGDVLLFHDKGLLFFGHEAGKDRGAESWQGGRFLIHD